MPLTSFAIVDMTHVSGVTGAHAAGAADVQVTNAYGTGTLVGAYAYDSGAVAPTLTSLSFTQGDTAGGGQSIVAQGTGFDASTTLTFGGAAATVTAFTSTTLTVTLPAHAAGVVDVVATNAGGSATLSAAFEFWSPVSTWLPSMALMPGDYDAVTGQWTDTSGHARHAGPTSGIHPTSSSGCPVFVGGSPTVALVTSVYADVLTDTTGGVVVGGTYVAIFETLSRGAIAAPSYSTPAIVGQESAQATILDTSDVGLVAVAFDNTSGAYVRTPSSAGALSTPHLAIVRWDGTNVECSVDGGAWQSVSAAQVAGYYAARLYIGRNYSSPVAYDGTIKLFATHRSRVSDADATRWRQWAQQRGYVS